jgi:multicomponent Na+:H+ antiporter subunit G
MELFILSLAVVGSFFCLVASIGVLRFKDFYVRIHAATKAGAFGGSLIALACGFHFNTLSIWIQATMLVVFFYLTAPVAAHMLSMQRYQEDRNHPDKE